VYIDKYFYNEGNNLYRLDAIQFADGSQWVMEDLKAMVLVETDGDDVIEGYVSDDSLAGAGGNDKLYGNGGNDALDGGVGNDRLYGGSGNDTLHGGTGNDYLEGGAGSDVYIFGRGDGQDSIYNADKSAGRVDVLRFLDGIAPSDVIVKRSGDHLYLTIRGTTDWVYIDNYFYNEGNNLYHLDAIQFADGSQWVMEDLKAMVLVETDSDDVIEGYVSDDSLAGAGGNDKLYGNGGNDQLDGGVGNDRLYGGSGNDTLHGGTGNDYLEGGDGEDMLIGASGDDTLIGGKGSDTYRFERGHGSDRIENNDSGAGKDVIDLLGDIQLDELVFSKNGSSLLIDVGNAGDRITIASWFSGNQYKVDKIHTADGSSMSSAEVDALIAAMATKQGSASAANTLMHVSVSTPAWASLAT
jgi:Ca2+-binding RTX toxin-like protein